MNTHETRNERITVPNPERQEQPPTYEEFQTLPDWQRMDIIANNRVINTDTYNRTMNHLRGPEGWKEKETYVLQMRRSPYGYHVAAGIEDAVAELTDTRITQDEVDFAEAFYTDQQIPFFHKDMWQAVIDEYDGKLPFEIHGALDGTIMLPGEPMMRVTGPGELIAHFEHVFHRPYYSTLVATKAHEITELLGDPNRFIEVGKRGTPNEKTHLAAAKAMQIGGGITQSSNDAAAATYPDVTPVGTIGHRYVQRFETVEAAFRHAINNLGRVSLLVDLVDSYEGIDTTFKLKREYRETDKEIGARLDSGKDLKDQARYFHDACARFNFTDLKRDRLTVEGFDGLEEIREIEAVLSDEEKRRTLYGAGGLMVADKTARSDASSGFKLSEYENEHGDMIPSMKFSNSPGKRSLPGKPTVIVINGERTIAQVNELDGQDLLAPLYPPAENTAQTLPADAYVRCQTQYDAALPYIETQNRATISPITQRKIGRIMCKYNVQADSNE